MRGASGDDDNLVVSLAVGACSACLLGTSLQIATLAEAVLADDEVLAATILDKLEKAAQVAQTHKLKQSLDWCLC